MATVTITSEKGVSVSAVAYAREEAEKKGMDGAQVTGAASSYARKYALNGLFCIDDGNDADSTNTHGKAATPTVHPKVTEGDRKDTPKGQPSGRPIAPPPAPQTKQASPNLASELQLRKMFACAKDVLSQEDLRAILKVEYQLESTKELTAAQCSELIAYIEAGGKGEYKKAAKNNQVEDEFQWSIS
jgi:hypothetical protein